MPRPARRITSPKSGDPAFKRTLDLLWTDLTMRKMYITGGVGSRSGGESFGDPYELPSEQAYAETCAAVANVMWNFRLLTLTGDARYADVLERTLYNGVNSGHVAFRNPVLLSKSAGIEAVKSCEIRGTTRLVARRTSNACSNRCLAIFMPWPRRRLRKPI